MASARERRRRGRNYTGILRGGRGRSEEHEISQIEGRSRGFSWRIISGLLVLALSGLLVLFFYSDAFYVSGITVGGTRYVTKEEVFNAANITDMHLFWIQPDSVRQHLLDTIPTIADAQVRVLWPPNPVNIVVEEREPAFIWEQPEGTVWVDIQGNIMLPHENRDDLIRVVAETPLTDHALTPADRLSEDIIFGILQLQELRPEVDVWRYDTANGLGFRNANGWDIWLGIGANMAEKMQIYETLSSDIIARGIQVGEINIANPDAPFYTVLWGR